MSEGKSYKKSFLFNPNFKKEHLAFNLDMIWDKSAYFEVHVHKDDKGNWMFSPNNAAFQIILTEPVTNFMILTIYPDPNGGFHMILSWWVFLLICLQIFKGIQLFGMIIAKY